MNIKKSLEYQERAKKLIPGMGQLLSKRPDQFGLGVWPSYFSKAKGSKVWDLDDNCYVDMSIGGIGATVLGYADDDVDNAVTEAISRGVASSLNCYEEVDLAELLIEHHPWAENVRYTRSGGEAMTVAVRIARAYSGKDKIAFCGYHGWHDWYLSANVTSKSNLNNHLIPGLNPTGVPKGLADTALAFNYNNFEQLEKIVHENKGEIAAIIMEPIRNVSPKDNFLENVRELATKNDIALIFDEISSGYRIHPGGAHLKFGITPDIAVFSKSIGNGYPMGAIIGNSKVMSAAITSFISSTCWTERTGPVAAMATLSKFVKNNVHEHLIKFGGMVQQGWKSAAKKAGIEISVSGIEPLSHFNFSTEQPILKAFFIQQMLEKGFLSSNLFYPMYAHSTQDVENYLKAVEEVFSEISKYDPQEILKTKLKGMPSGTGFARMN